MLRNYYKGTKRFYNTIKYLKFKQIAWRFWYKIYKAHKIELHNLSTKWRSNIWVKPAERQQSLINAQTFFLLGEFGIIDEIGWDGPERSKLWRYNQHYFDDLNAEKSVERISWHESIISKWIDENSVGVGSGWEPYPTSLRIVNWIKFALSGGRLGALAQNNLAVQARWLSRHIEWHILGNHLMANAKALYFSGLFFNGPEAESWRRNGLEIILNELDEQILTDGGHFELSPMYHVLAVEDFLDILNVARVYDCSADVVKIEKVLPSMLEWLKLMSHPDEKISFFNDSAMNIAPENSQIFDYAERLGILFCRNSDNSILSESGYFRLENSHAVVIGDIGRIGPDYLPSHAHADTLSFEFSLFGERLIVNSGTSEYGVGTERLRQRGTFAHSTLSINGVNSSDVWSGFRVGSRARPGIVEFQISHKQAMVEGSHDGYRFEAGSPIHRRKWLLESKCLKIVDTVLGHGSYSIDVIFRLHPDISVQRRDDNSMILTLKCGRIAVFEYQRGMDVDVEATTWHPSFGLVQQSALMRCTTRGSGTININYNFTWED